MSEEEHGGDGSPESRWIYLPARCRQEAVDMIYEGRVEALLPAE